MIHGAVDKAFDFGSVDGFDVGAFTIADPDNPHTFLITFFAARSGVELGHSHYAYTGGWTQEQLDAAIIAAVTDARLGLVSLIR